MHKVIKSGLLTGNARQYICTYVPENLKESTEMGKARFSFETNKLTLLHKVSAVVTAVLNQCSTICNK